MTKARRTYKKHYIPGYVYIATSPALKPMLYKVGYSVDPRRRMQELTDQAATALPLPYRTVFVKETLNMALAEDLAHLALAKYRVNSCREFFLVDLTLAKSEVSRACETASNITGRNIKMPPAMLPQIDLSFDELETVSAAPVIDSPSPSPAPAVPAIVTPAASAVAVARIARKSAGWLLVSCWLLIIYAFGFEKPSAFATVGLPLVYLFLSSRIDSHLNPQQKKNKNT